MAISPLDTTPGILALTGSGEYLQEMEPVDRQLLDWLGQPGRVACLPTAAAPDGASIVANWSRLGVSHFKKLGAQAEAVEILNRDDANSEPMADKVRQANFVYLSGGKPDYLYKTLAGTRTLTALEGVLARGGVVAGCSAGAMIWGEKIPSFPAMVPFRDAFNYLPGAIVMPHYDEMGERFAGAIKLLLGSHTVLGIDGYTALVCRGGKYSVLGKGGVTVWNKQQKMRYTQGQSLAWRGRLDA